MPRSCRALLLREGDRLRAPPQHDLTEILQAFAALHDRREVVPGQLAGLAREAGRAVGKEQLGLAHAAGIEQELARRGIARRVLRSDPHVELAERDPGGLAAPARLDELALER